MSFPFPSSNGEEPPPLKKTISSLPDDLLLSCLARVSRLYYPTLSLVSKKFHTLLASPELYKARSLLCRTESCLYVCLCDPNPRWFILCRKPNGKKKEKEKSIGYVLATIPVPHSPRGYPSVVAVGSNVYSIGGYTVQPSSSVWILDCISQTWHEGPSMLGERKSGHVNVCDGKIYVVGGYHEYVVGGCQEKKYSSNWIQVYDPETQTWEAVLCPVAEKYINEIVRTAVIEGEILMYAYGGKGLAYKPKEDRWTSFASLMYHGWTWQDCVIDNVLYCYSREQGGITWYDSNVGLWVNVSGLKGLPKIYGYSFVRLVCYGGKMAVLWLKSKPYSGGNPKAVWCAVIALERRNNNEIWGDVESIDDDVLTLPWSCVFKCAVTASIC